MSEDFVTDHTLPKADQYKLLLNQLNALIEGEKDVIANLSNIIGALHQSFSVLWTGLYFVKGGELVLGPYQGPVACTRIAYGKGVCGKAYEKNKTMIVDNVEKFPDHIACSALSKSEIVVPVTKNNQVYAVIDIDSDVLAAFDETDKLFLEKIAKLIEEKVI